MRKSGFPKKILLCLLSVICLTLGCFGIHASVKASAEGTTISASGESLEFIAEDPKTVIFYFSETDYITAEFDPDDDTAARYKWVDEISYEDRANGNVHNALLSLHLDEYNYTEYLTIDGVAIGEYEHTLTANKFQRIEGLGLSFADDVLTNATEIRLAAGCTLPTLARSYFGVSEKSAIVIEEETIYRKRNGQWVKTYGFDGYEAGVVYDGSDQFFYGRPVGSSFKGHLEAPTCEFSRNYEAVGDYNYVLTSTKDTVKGSLFVMDFVNPIDPEVFTAIHLKFYVHEPRTMVTYNASAITEESLGEPLEDVSTAQGWTTVTLMTALYANDDGVVDTLVFRFTNDGDLENAERNYVGVGEFSLGSDKTEGLIYENSLMIKETEEAYTLNFRFNKKGEFTSSVLDTEKVLINGVSLTDMQAEEDGVTAEWVSLSGIYQINITIPKAYEGAGQLKNADVDYACNKITLKEGLTFPNGEQLDRTYNYNVYRAFTDGSIFEKEVLIDNAADNTFKETKAKSIFWEFQKEAENNLRLYVEFDQRITNTMLAHICEHEKWRAGTLNSTGLYDAAFTEVFVAGGYKTSLMDSVLVNGQTVGEFHARNAHQTCIFVHYGQASVYGLDIFINSLAPEYATLAPLFESGEGVTVELKKGFKFTTGVQTMRDYKFVLKGGAFVLEEEEKEIPVYFDGQLVKDGDLLEIDYKALESSVWAEGASFEVTKTEADGVATFTVKYGDKQISFRVKETIVKSPDATSDNTAVGCMATVSGGAAGLIALAASAMILTRRKRDE